MTETIEFFDVEEDEFRAILDNLSDLYDKQRGFFEQGFTPIFKNYGATDELLFGVHLFSQGSGAKLHIVLSEYIRDARTASVNINSFYLVGWGAHSRDIRGEATIREFLQKLTYSELESHVRKGIYADSRELFICPKCSARYLLRALQVTEGGKVTCQNCDGLFSPIKS